MTGMIDPIKNPAINGVATFFRIFGEMNQYNGSPKISVCRMATKIQAKNVKAFMLMLKKA